MFEEPYLGSEGTQLRGDVIKMVSPSHWLQWEYGMCSGSKMESMQIRCWEVKTQEPRVATQYENDFLKKNRRLECHRDI